MRKSHFRKSYTALNFGGVSLADCNTMWACVTRSASFQFQRESSVFQLGVFVFSCESQNPKLQERSLFNGRPDHVSYQKCYGDFFLASLLHHSDLVLHLKCSLNFFKQFLNNIKLELKQHCYLLRWYRQVLFCCFT